MLPDGCLNITVVTARHFGHGLIEAQPPGERGGERLDRATLQIITIGLRFLSVVDRLRRRVAQFVVGVRCKDDFAIDFIPGDLLAHLLQPAEIVKFEPFVVFVERIVHDLLHFGLRHVTRKVMGVGGDLRTGGIEIGYGLDRLIVAVEIGRHGQPSVGVDAQHLALAAGALALHPVVRRAAQRIGRREGMRTVRR